MLTPSERPPAAPSGRPQTPLVRPAAALRLPPAFKRAAVAGAATLALLASFSSVRAQEGPLKGTYLEGGVAPHGEGGDTHAIAAGVLLSGAPAEALRSSRTVFYWDLFASAWRAPTVIDGRQDYRQIGIIATLRYRFGQGDSPWFADAGFGISTMDHHYQTPSHEFSTDFQFTEVLGLGHSFGEHQQYELSMRLQHVSNGGIRKPNPGENFVRLRGSYLF